MKLSDYRNDYYTFSGTASSVSRQVAFVGIALIWVFKFDAGSGIALPIELLWPALFFVIGLGLDLLHYVLASAIWGWFTRIKEKQRVAADTELSTPAYFNWPTLVCFWGKLIAVITGYVFLLAYVKSAIQFY